MRREEDRGGCRLLAPESSFGEVPKRLTLTIPFHEFEIKTLVLGGIQFPPELFAEVLRLATDAF